MTNDILSQAEAAWLNTSIECLEKTGTCLDKSSFVAGFIQGVVRTKEELLDSFSEEQ